MSRVALLALGSCLATVAHAQEYREFSLADGRTFVAEVVATEGAGMRVRVPQGETFVPFGDLADMVAVDQDAYQDQEPWRVYLAASATYRGGFAFSFRTMPAIDLLGPDDPGPLSPETAEALAACDADLACLTDAAEDVPWMWLVVARFDAGDVVFEAVASTGGHPNVARAPRVDPRAINAAAWEVLGLTPTAPADAQLAGVTPEPEPVPPESRPRRAMTRDQVLALSFVPVPGYPSLAQGDAAGFGLALAAVVPATALWVGATGKSAQSPAGHVALGAAGYYAATVAANQALGFRTFRRSQSTLAVGVAPTEHGGTSVNLTFVPH